MAQILYYSVHDVLEYDDLLLFRAMGHDVFVLGENFVSSKRANHFRPQLDDDAATSEWTELFHADGCSLPERPGDPWVISPQFVSRFDVTVVVHDVAFISANWNALRVRPTVWRTIGQSIEALESQAEPYRAEGLKIVRWSPAESRASNYIGHDVIIRAYKDPDTYSRWLGAINPYILTFSNAFAYRYPDELGFYVVAMQGQDYRIGGAGNEGLFNTLGVVSFEEQRLLYQRSLAYFYCTGTELPYTLNFIEAWMTGIPVIALSREVALSNVNTKFNEVTDLIEHGRTGYIVKHPEEANDLFKMLASRPEIGKLVSTNARRRAVELFSRSVIQSQWSEFLVSA